MEQKIISPGENYKGLDNWLKEMEAKKILLVCDSSIRYQKEFGSHLREMERLGVDIIDFRGFQIGRASCRERV